MAPGVLLDNNDHLVPTKAPVRAYVTPRAKPTRHGAPWNALLYRSVRSTPLTLAGARGSWLKVYNDLKSWYVFDGSGGAAVSNIGYGDSRPRQAESDHFDRTGITYVSASSFRTEIADEFANYLCKSTNYQLVKAIFYSSGSEAIEAMQKIILQYHAKEKPNPEKTRTIFIARERSYHGATLNALGASGYVSRRQIFEPVLPKNMEFISACNPYRDMVDGMTTQQYVEKLAKELEDKILELGPENVAGYLFEPVVGAALGCESAVEGYLTAMKKVCVKYGVLLALDEVMCGMGRTGYLHAWQEENVVPDVQILGKGLAGGYAQISAILIGPTIVDAFVHGPGNGAFSHGHTFQNFPVACAIGLAVQRIIQEDLLLNNVREKAPILRQKLESRVKGHRYVGDIRGKGFFLGIEFVLDKNTKLPFETSRNIAWRLHERGLTAEHGIYIYPGSGSVDGIKGDHIIIAPAFNITDDEIEILVERVTKLINDFFDEEDVQAKL